MTFLELALMAGCAVLGFVAGIVVAEINSSGNYAPTEKEDQARRDVADLLRGMNK